MPRCPMVRLRSGNVDRLRKEFIPHAKTGSGALDSVFDGLIKTGGENTVGDDSA